MAKVKRKVRLLYGGYYEKIVEVSYDGFLRNIPYGQCGYERDEDGIILISYNVAIFKVKHNGEIVFYDTAPDYSRTTIKHVSAFCKEFCPQYTYHDIKRMYYDFMKKAYPQYYK